MAPESRSVGRHRRLVAAAGGALLLALLGTAMAQGPASAGASRPVARAAPAEAGAAWQDLTPPQKEFLQPLQRNWSALDAPQKRKWMALSGRMPTMSPDERTRVQARMTEWAKLTPEQRGRARLRYQEARQVPPQDRQARWEAYQSLPPERRQQLAERAARAASAPAARRSALAASTPFAAARDQPQPKSNIVTPAGQEAQRRQVGPALVQARPGATTTLLSRPAAPPSHQQSGLPKIAATPEFVNKSTLLPRHGPQAAVAAVPAASGNAPRVDR